MSTKRDFQKAAAKLEKLSRQIGKDVPSGLRVIGEEVMLDAKASRPGAGVPRDTGVLASTGRVEGPNGSGEVELSFGGAAAPYALYQHEVTTLSHRLGEPRYLIRAVERWQANGASARRALNGMLSAVRALGG